MAENDVDLIKKLLEYEEYDPIGPLAKEAAAAIKRLREALRPFSEYYDALERNGRLDGFDLISRQNGDILGHADVQLRDIKAAHDAMAPPRSP